MTEHSKTVYCEKCKGNTPHLVSGSEWRGTCEDCGTTFDLGVKSQAVAPMVVKIEITGGIAEVMECPDNVFVEIIDNDLLK